MSSRRWGKLSALLTLGFLFLAACQPAVPGAANPPAAPTEVAGAVETSVPAEPAEPVSQATPAGEATALPLTGMQAPEDWQVLDDATRGYSLAYPPAWQLCQVTRYSWAFCETPVDPERMVPPRLYVSAYPQDSTNQDFEVYNFIPLETIREFMVLPVGESALKAPSPQAADYFTYTRLPDRVIAGMDALVIENDKVWEAPPGTKDRVVLLVRDGTIVILGSYYETPEQLAMFEQVLDSFRFEE